MIWQFTLSVSGDPLFYILYHGRLSENFEPRRVEGLMFLHNRLNYLAFFTA